MTFHRWVIHARVPDYLLCGWMALPTLEGTGHGIYSAHCVWLCGCKMSEPTRDAACPVCEHQAGDHDHQYGCNHDGCECDLSWRDIRRDFWPQTTSALSSPHGGSL
jgi:hypothetical protein